MARVVHRKADGVGIFLFDHGDDVVDALTQPEVDHLTARIAQQTGDDTEPPVVTVEAELGQYDAKRWRVARLARHQNTAGST